MTSIWTPNDPPEFAVSVDSVILTEEFTATAGQTVFTINNFQYVINSDALQVFVNGVKQQASHVTETSQTSFTLTEPCVAGDVVEAIAQTAISGNDFVTLDGIETLTNKTINLASNTLSGTKAEFNAALSDDDFVYKATSNAFTATQSITANSATAALTVTQTGAGNAFVVEDSASTDSTPFVIDASGQLGLGTTTPLVKFHAQADASLGVLTYTAGGGTSFLNRRSGGTIASPAVVGLGDTIAATAYQGYDGANYRTAAQIDAVIDGTPGTNDMPGRLIFATTADGASSPTERYRIASDGKHTKTGYVQITDSSANAALTVTQTGSGNAFVVEDSASTDATPFVIDGDGYVVSGRTARVLMPTGDGGQYGAAIEVLGAAGATSSLGAAIYNNAAPGFGGSLSLAKSNSATVGSHSVVASGELMGSIYFSGSDGTNFIRGAQIFANVDGSPGTNDMPGRLVFSTTADGASSPTERMRIDSAGNVGIGGAAAAGATLHVQKNITGATVAHANLANGYVQSDVTTAAYGYKSGLNTAASAFTLGELSHFQAAQGIIGATSAISFQIGFHAASSLTGATNNYGFYGNIAAATGRWNFYAAGTADNYFAGNTGIGIAPAATQKLYTYLGATSTSAAEYGTYSVIQASNTSGAVNKIGVVGISQAVAGYAGTGGIIGVQGLATLAAAVTSPTITAVLGTVQLSFAGTVTTAVGFQSALTNSGGATCTSAIGFYAPEQTAGTSNFGFYAGLASGANKWNFYAAGTAQNAFAGLSKFGAVTVPTSAVDTTSFGTNLVTNAAATYTVLSTDHTIVQTTAASTYTLPAAASFTGRRLHILTQFAGTVISASSNVVPLAGGSAGTAILAATAGKFAILQSNGTNWLIVAAN